MIKQYHLNPKFKNTILFHLKLIINKFETALIILLLSNWIFVTTFKFMFYMWSIKIFSFNWIIHLLVFRLSEKEIFAKIIIFETINIYFTRENSTIWIRMRSTVSSAKMISICWVVLDMILRNTKTYGS